MNPPNIFESTALYNSFLELFKSDFHTAYTNLRSRNKSKLLPYVMSFYRRWYHSALIDNTILTPANLAEVFLNEKEDSGEPTQLKENSIKVAIPVLKSNQRITSMKFEIKEYSLKSHPVNDDLAAFIDFCNPDISLDEDDNILESKMNDVLDIVSIYDPFYVEYLTLLAFKLKLLKKLPAIHSNRAQTTKYCDTFFKLPHNEIFAMIVEASLEISTSQLMGILPTAHNRLGKDYIKKLLLEPKDTDQIFQEFFNVLGLNIDSLLDFEHDEHIASEMYQAMMSGTFYLGIMLDKYFHTLFGFYLKLINIGYVIPSDFSHELSYALEALQVSDDISIGMFTPCSHYSLTKLGLEYFDQKEPDSPMQTLKQIPQSVLYDLVIRGVKFKVLREKELINSLTVDKTDDKCKSIYEVKVKLMNFKSFWKCFEFPDVMSLHEIYVFLCYEFECDISMNYVFYSDLTASPFAAYTSHTNKRRSKKAAESNLTTLQLEEKSKFLLTMQETACQILTDAISIKELRFELEIVKIKSCKVKNPQPCITRVSQAFKDFDFGFDDEWF